MAVVMVVMVMITMMVKIMMEVVLVKIMMEVPMVSLYLQRCSLGLAGINGGLVGGCWDLWEANTFSYLGLVDHLLLQMFPAAFLLLSSAF